jgi:hypothetical protein
MDLPDFEGRRMEPNEAGAFADEMRADFEGRELAWRADYDALLVEEWPWYDGPAWNRWRIAAYVAWASCPTDDRQPSSMTDFARLVGWTSARPLRRYRAKYAEIERLVSEAVMEPLLESRGARIKNLAELAREPDYKYFKHLELALKLDGTYQPSQDVNVRQTITADEMAQAQERAEEELAGWSPDGGDDD